MCTKLGRVETNARHPLLHQPNVLSCRQTDSVATAGEEKLARLASGQT